MISAIWSIKLELIVVDAKSIAHPLSYRIDRDDIGDLVDKIRANCG
jgi:hypothetical protein